MEQPKPIKRIVLFETSDGKQFTDPEEAEKHHDELWGEYISEHMKEAIRQEMKRVFADFDYKGDDIWVTKSDLI